MDIYNSGVSANSLFHFTRNQDTLINIIKNGFYIRYSLEDFSSISIEVDEQKVAFPMVCFCDIPLSQIKYHSKNYGSYAIGMTKNWASSKKISPIFYIPKDSLSAKLLHSISNYIYDSLTDKPIYKDSKDIDERDLNLFIKDLTKAIGDVGDLTRLVKPYKGKVFRDEKWSNEEVLFYNEREWRYILTNSFFEKHNIKRTYNESVYLNQAKRRAINLTIQKLKKLTFKPTDIKYIIVKEEREIPKMVKEIRNIYSDKTSNSNLELLYTKIFSLDQVISDF